MSVARTDKKGPGKTAIVLTMNGSVLLTRVVDQCSIAEETGKEMDASKTDDSRW
jgi:hypothetical protein